MLSEIKAHPACPLLKMNISSSALKVIKLKQATPYVNRAVDMMAKPSLVLERDPRGIRILGLRPTFQHKATRERVSSGQGFG